MINTCLWRLVDMCDTGGFRVGKKVFTALQTCESSPEQQKNVNTERQQWNQYQASNVLL